MIHESKELKAWIGRDDDGAYCVYLAQDGWGDANGGVKIAISEDQIDQVIAWLRARQQELKEIGYLRAAREKMDQLDRSMMH